MCVRGAARTARAVRRTARANVDRLLQRGCGQVPGMTSTPGNLSDLHRPPEIEWSTFASGPVRRKRAAGWLRRAVPLVLLICCTPVRPGLARADEPNTPAAKPVDAQPRVIQIHDGRHWVWYARDDQFRACAADIKVLYDYADRAFDRLVEVWGLDPPATKYALYVWPQTGGGFAAPDIADLRVLGPGAHPGIGVSYDAFTNSVHDLKGWWAYAIITHEMCNLVLAQTVSHGWPVDWWANHISPFPKMTAVQIEYALRPDVAIDHERQMDAPLDKLFARLQDQYGWALFRRAFAAARADGINWERIGKNPSPLRTNYVCAYLQLAAPEDLRPILGGTVPGYDPQAVADIQAARQRWRTLKDDDPQRIELREQYLRGEALSK